MAQHHGPMPSVLSVVAAATGIKLLLIPTYHSTDMDVHRNWKAITHSVPLRQWYIEDTSEWTLDYPPLFAWMEYLLSQLAPCFDPEMLRIQAEPYFSVDAKLYMRLTVMATDIILLAAVLWYCRVNAARSSPAVISATMAMIACNAGLLMVDHVHFQYNGVLLGVLIASLAALQAGNALIGGILFAVLLNMKHLFLVLAPTYFVFILRGWVWGPGWLRRFSLMGAAVLAVCASSLGPIIATGQGQNLLQRLFPFKRGLLHAYWAPNAWALYAGADRVLGALGGRLGWLEPQQLPSTTSGLVQETIFKVLPQVGAGVAALVTVAAMAPCLVALWRRPEAPRMPRACAYAALCGFMFGFHVHEKAALPVVVLLALDAPLSSTSRREYWALSTTVVYSLLPLLYRPQEYTLKVLMAAMHCIGTHTLLSSPALPCTAASGAPGTGGPAAAPAVEGESEQVPQIEATRAVSAVVAAYVWGLVPLECYCSLVHPLVFRGRMEFLPLMLVSLYCSVGITAAWARMAAEYWRGCLGHAHSKVA